MGTVASFEDIRVEFERRVRKIVWCTVATTDTRGRVRTRLLHPVWEGKTGYILSYRDSLKAKHLAANPYVSLSYWDPDHQIVYIDGTAEWLDDPVEKERIWQVIESTDPPYGYDPATIWSGPDDPTLGALAITPWRVELTQTPRNDQARVWSA